MKTNATMISCYARIIGENGIEDMKTIGDRIEQLLKEFGRARYDGAPPYTQVDLMEMLTGQRPAPDGKYYHVSTNKSTINRILMDKQQPSHEVLFAICDMFNTDTEWILRGNMLEPEKIPDKFNTDEANRIGAIVDDMLPPTRRLLEMIANELLEIDQRQHASNLRNAELLTKYINQMANGDQQKAREYIESTGYRA